jgi:hypothetical protein
MDLPRFDSRERLSTARADMGVCFVPLPVSSRPVDQDWRATDRLHRTFDLAAAQGELFRRCVLEIMLSDWEKVTVTERYGVESI